MSIKLGKIIEEGAFPSRDAVHVAVIPVIAGEDLRPGTHVGITPRSLRASGSVIPLVGVVDPFLTETVRIGEVCWLFMYPDAVKSLHHDWTHQAFDAARAAKNTEHMTTNKPDSPDYDEEADWCATECNS